MKSVFIVKAFLFILLSVLINPEHLKASNNSWEPWSFKTNDNYHAASNNYTAVSPSKLTFHAIMFLYKSSISPVDGQHCPMYPSCSSYCAHSINEYGFLVGLMMATDRLHRCGHDQKYYSNVYFEERILKYDPAIR